MSSGGCVQEVIKIFDGRRQRMIHLQDLQEKVIYVLLDGTLKENEYVMMKLT